MSWIRENSLGWVHKAVARILKCGVIPKHVAFIMDGNRRFARKAKIEKFEGHTKGFDKLSETLQWCLDLGITEVTVYAFSIENFKRSKEEVDGLMELARNKFERLLMEKDKLSEKGVSIHILGDKSLLPEDIRQSIYEIEDMTKDNSKAFLNVAFSYTAQNEITTGVNKILSELSNGNISEDDVTFSLLSNSLYTAHSKPPEIIIRTSGEKRLSDFLLLQGCWSYIEFTDVLWPELSVWHLFWIIFKYQCLLRTQFNNKIESSHVHKSSDLMATSITS